LRSLRRVSIVELFSCNWAISKAKELFFIPPKMTDSIGREGIGILQSLSVFMAGSDYGLLSAEITSKKK
jgi:hypothetical protein